VAARGARAAAGAAKRVTSTIPIVINVGIDPVQFGLVASLNRPGGNVTGLAILTAELAAKRLELLHESLPTTTVLAMLVNPTTPLTEPETRGVRDAARSLGLQPHVLNASTESEIDTAFGTLVELRAGALVVSVDPFLNNQRAQIVTLAAPEVGARAFSPPLCLRLARSGIATLRTFAERLRTGCQAAPIRAIGSFSRITTPRIGQVGISARATHHATDRRLCPLLSGRLAAGQERGLVVPGTP
jgi:hypothetical protein